MKITRREFIKRAGLVTGALLCPPVVHIWGAEKRKRPNLVFVFADQWRAQDTGYAGNADIYTPNIDKLAQESLNFKYAVSCMPVSTPYRATLLTGQYAQTHGLFLNDVTLNPEVKSIGKIYKSAGYNTGYIGKWHINGNGRSNYIPESHRQGFDYFKVLECTHDYNHSRYYDNNDKTPKWWEGYDVMAQTDDACCYIEEYSRKDDPFVLFLSWGPPHNPYESAPEEFKNLYEDKEIKLRPNVPESCRSQAIKDLKGYYAHISAMDACVGQLQKTIKQCGIDNNTIFVLTSDHGDMLGSQGQQRKQKPYDESILVPFLLKYPNEFGSKGKKIETLFNSVDIMPTLLAMSGLPIPDTVEGKNIYPILKRQEKDSIQGTLIECVTPFGEWERCSGGREYRGVRTKRYTYVKDLNGPWLLYDNRKDPYQMNNLVKDENYADLRIDLDALLMQLLSEKNDQFLPGEKYIEKWGYKVNKRGTVEYTP